MWCCYCWPVPAAQPGNRAFFINQAGDILGTQNRPTQAGGSYDAFVRIPAFDAAFTAGGDMGSEPALAAAGLVSVDTLVWTPVGN